MTPVSVLPAAGVTVALGRMLLNATQETGGETIPLLINGLGNVLFSGGLAIFEQLPLIFAIGVAIGFTGGAGVAGLASVAGYLTLVNVLKVITKTRGLELDIDTGVFGGIIIGLASAGLYNRFFQTHLHPVLGFFSGKRLVPIISVGAAIVIGLVLGFVWPPIQAGINAFGLQIMDSQLGPAFYAAGKRLLIPVGLHHVYYPPFLFQFGEFTTQAGTILQGESPRYFAGDPNAGRFMASEFPIMLFGLPAAAFAIYLRASKAKRAAVGGVMLSAALTSIITGITEPIEFAFIFVAPLLYVIHVLIAFLSGSLTAFFDIHLGYTFSASLIDFILGYFNQKNSLFLFAVVGPAIAALYFSVFYWLIGLLDLKTPGRETDEETEHTAVSAGEKSKEVLKALGGAANIEHLDACITRLRLSVRNTNLVDKAYLKRLGAAGIMDAGGGNLQVVFGVESDKLKGEIEGLIKQSPSPTSNQLNLISPLTGTVVALEDVPDETFSQKLMGDGIAIKPSKDTLYAPVDATIMHLFPTNHALGLQTKEGVEILIHIGIDTVTMKGEGFKAWIKAGDEVKQGAKLITFDLDLISEKAKSTITTMTITNMDRVSRLKPVQPPSSEIDAKQGLLEVELNKES